MNLRERRMEERVQKVARRIQFERQRGIVPSYPNLDVICAPTAEDLAPVLTNSCDPPMNSCDPPMNEDK